MASASDRRRFQFSLRTVFLLVTATACIAALVSWWSRREQRASQELASALIEWQVVWPDGITSDRVNGGKQGGWRGNDFAFDQEWLISSKRKMPETLLTDLLRQMEKQTEELGCRVESRDAEGIRSSPDDLHGNFFTSSAELFYDFRGAHGLVQIQLRLFDGPDGGSEGDVFVHYELDHSGYRKIKVARDRALISFRQ